MESNECELQEYYEYYEKSMNHYLEAARESARNGSVGNAIHF